jgi:hypothetical protein
MSVTVVRYRTKPDRGDENQALIEKVFQELKATQPPGLRYTSLRLEDGVSFVHVAIVDTADGSNPLGATAAFQQFTRDIAERCDEPPVASAATEVGHYYPGVAS